MPTSPVPSKTKAFEIVAHRGMALEAPENTIASFRRALELGADGVELDVRLSADHVPVVYHYFYLDMNTDLQGVIFDYSLAQLRQAQAYCMADPALEPGRISTLPEILDLFAGKIGLEIEIKGPEPESAEIIGGVLNDFRHCWSSIEVTSYEPALLLAVQKICPGICADLLFPRSESWMKLDVVQYQAIHRARLAHARAVHLHPTQLTEEVVAAVRRNGIEVHAWDVNDVASLELAASLGLPRLCTDDLRQALAFRERVAS
jgi:glycerophosphoryl diester phosphodiesterase